MSLWQTFKRFLQKWFYKPSTPSALPTPSRSPIPPISAEASSDYQKIYLEHLEHLYGNIKGFFIPRSIAPKLKEIFVEPELGLFSADRTDRDTKRVWQWMEGFNALWITGRPGSGKTTLLLHMTLTLNKRLSTMLASPKQPEGDPLPILLYLRNHRQEINDNPTYTLAQAAHNALMIHQINQPLPANWFLEQLKKGRCLVMMDGLDEVPDTQRQGVARWIEQQIKSYDKNHFIITSRLLNPALLSDVTVLKIEPFSHQQVQRFVKRWYLAYEGQAHITSMMAQEQANRLMALLSKPAYNTLASNPLLLTMMLSYHCHPERDGHRPKPLELPRRRADLYAKVCDIALNEPSQSLSFETSRVDKGGQTSVKQKLRLLQPLAYQMMKHHRSSLHLDEARKVLYVPLDLMVGKPNVSDFLQGIEKQSGLLHKNGEYAFAQRTFQEYMTALYIAEQGFEKELMDAVRLENSWWHETTYFYSTYTDATPIMIAFLRHKKLSLPMLRLAINCMQQPGEVELEVQNRWKKRLKDNIEDPSPERRGLVAQGLLSLRLKHMVPVDKERYVADSLITNAEYELFTTKQAEEQTSPYSADASIGSTSKSGLEPVSGVEPTDAVAFCQWLTERDREGWHYRLPDSGEFSPLLSEMAYWVFDKTEEAYKKENEANKQLSLSLLEERLRSALAYDLAHDGNQARESLLAFSYDLEQLSEPTRALALASTFAYERAHHYATNAPPSPTIPQPHKMEHTRLAKFVTERLLRILRQDSTPPSSSSIKRIGNEPQAKARHASDTTLAEQYFTLHRDLQHIQKQTNNALPASGGIRLVAYRPAQSRPAAVKQNKSRRSKRNVPSMRKTTRQKISQASSTSKQTRIIQKKICILGNANVGKTSLLRRFVEGHFDERYLSTVGVNILRKTLERESYTMNMVLWEIEGGHGFKKEHIEYLHGVTGAIIVCDLTRHETLAGLEQYANQLRALNSASFFVIVGNKVDLTKKRAITYEQLNAVSKKLGCPYILTSAKTGTQVNDAFSLLADQIEKASS